MQCFHMIRWIPKEFSPNEIPGKKPLIPDIYNYQKQKISALYPCGELHLVIESVSCYEY